MTTPQKQYCDGKRRRRNSPNRGRRLWYSYYRGIRFSRKWGMVVAPSKEGFVLYCSASK